MSKSTKINIACVNLAQIVSVSALVKVFLAYRLTYLYLKLGPSRAPEEEDDAGSETKQAELTKEEKLKKLEKSRKLIVSFDFLVYHTQKRG